MPEFKCEICGKEFDIAVALAGHMRSHQEKEVKTESVPQFKKEIMLHQVEGEPGSVEVIVQGKRSQLQKGVWISDVKDEVVEVLRNAVVETSEYVEVPNMPGQFTMKPVSYVRYPFSERLQTVGA